MSVSEVRTQIYLDRAQHQALREAARKRGVSMAQVVREAVAKYLMQLKERPGEAQSCTEDPIWDLPEVAESFPGIGGADVSRRHDDILYGQPER